ncbi:MAG: hypothetical protein ACOVOE_10920 [Caulobacter sp.]
MNFRVIIGAVALLGLAACGRDSPETGPAGSAVEVVMSTEGLPKYDSEGVIASLEGQILTLDHEGASPAGLKPGRDRFRVYADVLAEAPITPGSRVSFSFKKTPRSLDIAQLRARP